MSDKLPVRIVGRRRADDRISGGLEAADGFQKMANEVLPPGRKFPRGVFRFHSHEEADEWMMKWLTRAKPESQPSKTS